MTLKWPYFALGYASLAACGVIEQRYVVEREQIELTRETQMSFLDENDDPVFQVERRFEFPVEPPTDQALRALGRAPDAEKRPFPRKAWVQQDDFDISIDYALTNRDDAPITATVLVNGANEFIEYAPGPDDFSQWERRVALGPKERIVGHVSELELDEVAIDLATVANGAPNSNQVVQRQSQSGRDTRIRKYIPRVIPELLAVRLGLSAPAAQRVRLEFSLRIRDLGGRLVQRGRRRWQPPSPMRFTPVVPESAP